MNVLSIKKLFYKAAVIYIIKNKLTFKTKHGHNTRQISNIKVPTMHKKLTQSTYLYIGPKIYNILPLEIKQSNSLKILKKKITLWLLQELPLYYIDKNIQKEINKVKLNCMRLVGHTEYIYSMVTFVVIKEKLTPILGLKSSVELGLSLIQKISSMRKIKIFLQVYDAFQIFDKFKTTLPSEKKIMYLQILLTNPN
ncbi:Integrase catalytic domain-containing protein, partial [Aphis craccivora]